MWSKNRILLLSLLLFVIGFLILVEQYVNYGVWFEVKDIHHETFALSSFSLAIGIIVGAILEESRSIQLGSQKEHEVDVISLRTYDRPLREEPYKWVFWLGWMDGCGTKRFKCGVPLFLLESAKAWTHEFTEITVFKILRDLGFSEEQIGEYPDQSIADELAYNKSKELHPIGG